MNATLVRIAITVGLKRELHYLVCVRMLIKRVGK